VDDVIYYKNVFVYLVSTNSPLKLYVPVEEEWEKVTVIYKFLKLFYKVTCMFSAVKTPTSILTIFGKELFGCKRSFLEYQIFDSGQKVL